MTDHVREATKKAEPVRVVICAGPGRWLCTVGYGHLCGDASNPERTGGRAMRYLAVDEAPDLPRRVWAEDTLRAQAEAAIACWNALRPGTFELVPALDGFEAEVAVVPTVTRTFVDFTTAWPLAVVYCGADLDFWLPHELGHALGLADHVLPGMNTTGYVRPVEASEAYRGVMSYQASREQWFGPDDVRMMREVFPLPHRVTLAEVAT